MSYFFDMHSHLSLQPYYNRHSADITKMHGGFWNVRKKDASVLIEAAVENLAHVPQESQTHLYGAIVAGVKCIVNSLYPIEFEFMVRGKESDQPSNLWDKLLTYIIGMEKNELNKRQKQAVSYFTDLTDEFQYIQSKTGYENCPSGHFSFQIVKSYDELINLDGNTIGIILSIEGSHSLSSIFPVKKKDYKNYETEGYKDSVMNNLPIVKNWNYPPFFISPAHHFYNQSGGLSESIEKIMSGILVRKQNIRIKGIPVFETGISDFGLELIEQLLDRSSGARILIDVKHLSPKARYQYYKLLDKKRTADNDHIPVIASHAAINGLDSPDDPREEVEPFNNGWINLFNDEIKKIIDTDGLIGIMLDEKRLYCRNIKKEIMKLRKKGDTTGLKKAYIKILLTQILHIAQVTNAKGLNHVCLGSDFDGVINPVDIYAKYEHWPEMRRDMETFINTNLDEIDSRYKQMKDLVKQDVNGFLDNIFWNNAEQFLKKYFNPGYLGRD